MKIIINNRYNAKISKLNRYLSKARAQTIEGHKNNIDLMQLLSFLKENLRNRKREQFSWTKDLVNAICKGIFFEEPIYIISAADEKDIHGKHIEVTNWKKHLATLRYLSDFTMIKISHLTSRLFTTELIDKLKQLDTDIAKWSNRDRIIFKIKYLWTIVHPGQQLSANELSTLIQMSPEAIQLTNENCRTDEFLISANSFQHFKLLTRYKINHDFLIDSAEKHNASWVINDIDTFHKSRKPFIKKHPIHMPVVGTVIVHLEEFITFEHKLHHIHKMTIYPARIYKYDKHNTWWYREVKSYIVNHPSFHSEWKEAFVSNLVIHEFHKYFVYEEEIKNLQAISDTANESEKHNKSVELFMKLITNNLNSIFRYNFRFKSDVFGKRIIFNKKRREYTIKIATDFEGSDFLYNNHDQNFDPKKTEHNFYFKNEWPLYDTMQIFRRFCLKVIKTV